MSSYIGQTPGSIQGDIYCNSLNTQTLRSSSVTVTLPVGFTYLTPGQLGLDYKVAGTLVITGRTTGGLDPEYASVLAYLTNNAIFATVTMMSSAGLVINTDGIQLQIANETPSELLLTLNMLWL